MSLLASRCTSVASRCSSVQHVWMWDVSSSTWGRSCGLANNFQSCKNTTNLYIKSTEWRNIYPSTSALLQGVHNVHAMVEKPTHTNLLSLLKDWKEMMWSVCLRAGTSACYIANKEYKMRRQVVESWPLVQALHEYLPAPVPSNHLPWYTSEHTHTDIYNRDHVTLQCKSII